MSAGTVQPLLTISDDAALHLRQQLGSRVLRIAFTTGCGGSGYRLSFEDRPLEEDVLIDHDGIAVALDSMAASRLMGAVIRYSGEEDGYTLDHPDAVMAMWCG